MKCRHKKRIDRHEAFISYCTPCADGRLKSYADVAQEYGVSERTIEKIGAKENWVNVRSSFGKNRINIFKQSREAAIEIAENRHLDAYITIQERITRFLEKLDEGDSSLTQAKKISLLVQTLKSAIDGERVIFNLPTSVKSAQIIETSEKPDLTDEEIKEIDERLARFYASPTFNTSH